MHQSLLEELRECLIKNEKDIKIFEHSHENLYRILFKNYYKGHGLNLSLIGYELFSLCYSTYVLEFPKKYEIKTKHKMFFDDFMKMPYYFESNNKFICFDEEFIIRLKFYNDDIDFMMSKLQKK